jgi:hypothetical protein
LSTVLFAGLAAAAWVATLRTLFRLVRRLVSRPRRPRSRHLRGPRPARAFLPGWIVETGLGGLKRRADRAPRLRVGHVRLAPRLEPYHLLVTGSPGSGKSTVVEGLLRTLRRRGQPAIVFDVGGESWASLARPEDRLLNPLDARSVPWSPFAEMEGIHDAARLARALVPSGHGEGQEWHHYAQGLLAQVLAILWARGERTNGRLLDVLVRASDGELRGLLAGTVAGRLFAPGAERMAASVRAILGSYLPALETLDPAAGAHGFGCGPWVRRADEGGGWLFLTVRDATATLQRPLVSAVLDLTISAALTLPPDPARRLWLVLDEFDSLGTISGLLDALTKGRKYGLAVVAGLQSVAQLERRYGREGARVLLACFATKVFLRSSDAETAEYASHQLGERECLVTETTRHRGGRSRAHRLVRERLVLAGEIATLADRRGWIQRPGPRRCVRLRIPVVRRSASASAFVARASSATEPRGAAGGDPARVRPDPFPLSLEEVVPCRP